MIDLMVLGVGNIKEKYMQELISDYETRISKYARIKLVTVKDEANGKQGDQVIKEIEGKRILEAIDKGYYIVLLDLKGEMLDSVQFSKKIDEIATYHSSKICFVIGGSLGVSDEVKNNANYKLCFSKMTFPHQFMKGILLEQIYRAFKISNNETYHK